ncbi:Short-chain dehydrogenase/reductase SDR [Penicillium expansum]|uniref:Short-chain dehydrogenase/reductase SDR n=1 Tax=Penicillium expansum TaxID=27334 RepID=A0A0A2J592_PENEN|nr:Short-chain dehydrogenase/reductase SDR [Penicillium expansum]KGO49838.1 Short-chain dehydrogenase/reductase SDR [Penicillium expansum]
MTTPVFAGQIILITGAASGIGRATSIKLAIQGASLALTDINSAALSETETKCSTKHPGQSHSLHTVDVSDAAAVDAMVAAVVACHGRLDHIFNCAGVNPTPKSILETTDTYWQLLVSVNLQGTFNVCRAGIPHLRSGASVVNVSSIAGVRPCAGMAVYAATKAAPGDIHTPTNAAVVIGGTTLQNSAAKIALGRLGQPDEVADVVLWLLQSSFVNGSVVEINGGVE